jgi:hypothetical protein
VIVIFPHRERPVDDTGILVHGRSCGSLKLKYNDEKEGLCFTLNADLTQECVLCQRRSDALNAPAL